MTIIHVRQVLHKLPDLEYLALQKCKIGDKGLNAITTANNKMGALSNSEYLWIQVTDAKDVTDVTSGMPVTNRRTL